MRERFSSSARIVAPNQRRPFSWIKQSRICHPLDLFSSLSTPDQGFNFRPVRQTAGLRYRYTGPFWPVTGRNRWNSNLNSNFAVQPVRTGLPAGLTGNRPNSNFFLFWFKFKCPQSILNKYLYNIF